jgi:hypothetical protein
MDENTDVTCMQLQQSGSQPIKLQICLLITLLWAGLRIRAVVSEHPLCLSAVLTEFVVWHLPRSLAAQVRLCSIGLVHSCSTHCMVCPRLMRSKWMSWLGGVTIWFRARISLIASRVHVMQGNCQERTNESVVSSAIYDHASSGGSGSELQLYCY